MYHSTTNCMLGCISEEGCGRNRRWRSTKLEDTEVQFVVEDRVAWCFCSISFALNAKKVRRISAHEIPKMNFYGAELVVYSIFMLPFMYPFKPICFCDINGVHMFSFHCWLFFLLCSFELCPPPHPKS